VTTFEVVSEGLNLSASLISKGYWERIFLRDIGENLHIFEGFVGVKILMISSMGGGGGGILNGMALY
jgi:hypothetical protein